MNNHGPRGIYDMAVKILSDLAPNTITADPATIIIHGADSALESIVLVNMILEMEEELSSRRSITIDLVEFIARFDRSITLGEFARELEARIAKA